MAGPPDPSSHRWREVDRAFSEALELDDVGRRRLLTRLRADDPELAERLRTLLNASRRSRDFLEEPIELVCELPWSELFGMRGGAEEEGRALDPPEPSDRSGTRVGPWHLVERIGHGGMASVYLAERADGQWRQRVAVKLLHPGLNTEVVVRRFVEERQILSSLDHPGIARFLGGGTTDDGFPFLVMEYVDGRPLLDYCLEESLPLKARLRLFCSLARAVGAAHRQLVVHRDVKPSNVLVDREGRVRLLDFGIARLLAGEPGTHTRIEHRAVTPAYASPEQVSGDPVTTASDVYQLGLLLSELICGRRPYEVNAMAPGAAARTVMEAEPTRPSAHVHPETAATMGLDPRRLARRLRGDLDSIVLQALEKAPEDRYPSAEAMAADVERHLGGEVVEARTANARYRARKFVRRHWMGVSFAATVVLVLVVASGVLLAQVRRVAAERDRARAEQQRAEDLTEFMSELFAVVDPTLGGEADAGTLQLLDEGVDRARTTLAGAPTARADVLARIGGIYSTLSLHDRAVPVLEEAVALRRSGAGDQEALVQDLIRLGYSRAFVENGSAVPVLQEAIATAETELGPNHHLLAEALARLAELAPGEVDDPLGMARRAVEIMRSDESAAPPAKFASVLYAAARLEGRLETQLRLLEEALALRREHFGRDNPGTAVVLNEMGLRLEGSDPVAADTLLREAAAMHERLYGLEHRTTLTILNNHAGVLRDQGRHAEAEPIYRRILEVRARAYPEDRLARAYTLHGLGWVTAEQGRPREGEAYLRETLSILEEAGDDLESQRFQVARNTLGRALYLQGRYDEAEALLRSSYDFLATADLVGDLEPYRTRLAELDEERAGTSDEEPRGNEP